MNLMSGGLASHSAPRAGGRLLEGFDLILELKQFDPEFVGGRAIGWCPNPLLCSELIFSLLPSFGPSSDVVDDGLGLDRRCGSFGFVRWVCRDREGVGPPKFFIWRGPVC